MFFFVLGQAVTQKGKKGSRAFVPDLGGTPGAKKQDLTHRTVKKGFWERGCFPICLFQATLDTNSLGLPACRRAPVLGGLGLHCLAASWPLGVSPGSRCLAAPWPPIVSPGSRCNSRPSKTVVLQLTGTLTACKTHIHIRYTSNTHQIDIKYISETHQRHTKH